MIVNLDNQVELEKIDTGKIISSIRLLPDQMEEAWEEIKKIDIPQHYYHAKNLVISGMGGSALGGRIIDSLLVDRVRIPIEIVNSYKVPNYVNKDSFVFASSYSGNTEEIISATKHAISKGGLVFGSIAGGKLKEIFEENGLPYYHINPISNPSGQPRMGLGYAIFSTLSVLSKCNYIQISDDEFYKMVVLARSFVKEYDLDVGMDKNLAKLIAKSLHEKAVILIASEHLVGVVHAFKNQLNENSKNFSTSFDIPELNHHLLEGLSHPANLRGLFHFLMFESDLYPTRVGLLYGLTREIIEKNKHSVSVFQPRSETKLSQIIETLIMGSFVSYYLAILNNVDPVAIPYVDYFKEKLSLKN